MNPRREGKLNQQALEGVKVVAFTWLVAGPLIAKYLADHGATVIKIESNTRPELLRVSPPFAEGKPGINQSGYFNFINPNKYSVSINLNLPEGIEVAKRLMAWADVVVENFRPGVLKRMGLGYEDIKKINPRLVMLSATMVGQEGPSSTQPGIGAQMVSHAGFTHITGWSDRGPTQPYGAYTDIPAPSLGIAALMIALLHQRQTGEGQYLDLSQFETGVTFLAPLVLDCAINSREGSRQGNTCAYACPHSAYPCQGDDRWVTIAVFNDEEWQAFCQVLDNPEWTASPELSTLLGRKRNEELIDKLVGEWTINFSAEEVMDRLQAAGIAAGVVQTGKDLLEDPHLKFRNHFWKMEHSEMGEMSFLGESFILSETPAQPRMPAPCLGEHTEYICREFLGMSDTEFVELLSRGALS